MDYMAQFMSEKYSNPIKFLNKLRQTTETDGGMEYCNDGEYVEYDVAVEAVKKAQNQLIDKAAEWIDNNVNHYIFENEYGETYIKYTFTEDFIKAMKGE